MTDSELLFGNMHHGFGKLVDGDHLLGANVHRASEIGLEQAPHTFHALVHIKKRSGLLAITPNLNLATIRGLRYLTAHRRRRFLAASVPRSLRPEDVVET